MSANDLIANGLAMLKNAQLSRKEEVLMPTNRTLTEVIRIFKEKGYISDYRQKNENKRNYLAVKLKYGEKQSPVISEVGRLSKCSRRIYRRSDELPRIANGYATVIVSTSKGVMTSKQAKEINQGGEVLCFVM